MSFASSCAPKIVGNICVKNFKSVLVKGSLLKNQLSFGMIQEILSGSTLLSNKCTTASIPVFPPPIITYFFHGDLICASPFTGTRCALSEILYSGGLVAGTWVKSKVASTVFFEAFIYEQKQQNRLLSAHLIKSFAIHPIAPMQNYHLLCHTDLVFNISV